MLPEAAGAALRWGHRLDDPTTRAMPAMRPQPCVPPCQGVPQRRARANSEIITSRATIFRSDLDHATPEQHPRFDTPLANMVHMVGAAAGAWLRRFGIAPPAPGLTGTPQQIASIIASGWLLAATVTASARFWRPG